jgi:peptidoglycan/LPS O-acetylase OafA/YrhL
MQNTSQHRQEHRKHEAPSESSAASILGCGSQLAYQPELDGIRAIAIIAVLLFHAGITGLAGGFLGVDVFFVVSGYLITTLLIREQLSSGRIGLRAFYFRRIRRLLPALLVMLFVTVTCSALFMKDVVASTVRDLPWALAGLSNWWFIFHQQSYFEAIGRAPLLQHTWSLGVETQFYLISPVALVLLLPTFGVMGVRRAAIACGAVSFAAMLAVASSAHAAASHAYFGTDTHSMGLFLGAALAATPMPMASRFRIVGRSVEPFADVFGFVAFAALLALFNLVDESTSGLYRIGLPLTSILSVVLIAVARVPGGITGKCLAVRPLRWIGQRSYGMYLWHWPVFQATRPGIDLVLPDTVVLVIRLALTAAIAELSYRYIETPIRRGALRRVPCFCTNWNRARLRYVAVFLAVAVTVIVVADTGLIWSAIAANTEAPRSVSTVSPPETAMGMAPLDYSVNSTPSRLSDSYREDFQPRPTASTQHGSQAGMHGNDALGVLQTPALVLGDSVLLGVSQCLAEQVNVVKVDAVVGRQATDIRDRIESIAESGKLQPTIIVNFGNNGTVEEHTLRTILDKLGACERIMVVNARVPRPWQDRNNALMARIVPSYTNAVLVDWHEASVGHREYFGPDGVHTGALGARAYANLVVSALRSTESTQLRGNQEKPATQESSQRGYAGTPGQVR